MEVNLDKIITLLEGNPTVLTALILLLSIFIVILIFIVIVAFIQGREICFYPPKIGPKPNLPIGAPPTAVESVIRESNLPRGEINIADSDFTGIDILKQSEFISPLCVVEQHFLQVLLHEFKLSRSGNGSALDIKFDHETLTLWSRLGKRDLNKTLSKCTSYDVNKLQQQLDNYLTGGVGDDTFQFLSNDMWFRFASGGALPIVKFNKSKKEYYCFFYREVSPIGWNIANGGCDTREELLSPIETIKRELSEELIIIDPKNSKRYIFAETHDRAEFVVVRQLLNKRYPSLKLEDLQDHLPELIWENGPDKLTVSVENGPVRITNNCFININAIDLGIEIDRVVKIPVEDTAIFLDGELCEGAAPDHQLVNAPVALFEVDNLNSKLATGSFTFTPDILFWSGERYEGTEYEQVIRNFFRTMMGILTQEEKDFYNIANNKYDLCPVTRNIVKRYISHNSPKPNLREIDKPKEALAADA